jgi:hypothetical protein
MKTRRGIDVSVRVVRDVRVFSKTFSFFLT